MNPYFNCAANIGFSWVAYGRDDAANQQFRLFLFCQVQQVAGTLSGSGPGCPALVAVGHGWFHSDVRQPVDFGTG